MAIRTRKKRARQEDLWVVSSEVVASPAHAFYDWVNQILDEHHFDGVEHLCPALLQRGAAAPGSALFQTEL